MPCPQVVITTVEAPSPEDDVDPNTFYINYPGFTDMVDRAKWDAWNGLAGKGTDDAMQEYVDLIDSLK